MGQMRCVDLSMGARFDFRGAFRLARARLTKPYHRNPTLPNLLINA